MNNDIKKIELPQSIDGIKNMFYSFNYDNIINDYSKKQLVDMYSLIFSSKPLSRYDKRDIAHSIKSYFQELSRTQALSELCGC